MTKFLRTQLPMFILSLLLSFIIWLNVSGQDMSSHDLTASFELLNIPANLAIDSDVPETVVIRVEANTAQFRYLEGRKFYLRHDASLLEAGLTVVSLDSLKIEPALPRGVRINRIIPGEVSFTAHPFVSKDLPITVSVVGELKDYLKTSGPLTISPESAKITGPSNRLETIQSIPTTPIHLDEIVKPGDFFTVTPNMVLDAVITIEPKEFKVTPSVEVKRKNLNFQVPIKLIDATLLNRQYKITLGNEIVNVTVSWPLNLAEPPLDSDGGLQASVSLDLIALKTKKSQRVSLDVTAPKGVEIISFFPAKVDVTHQVLEVETDQSAPSESQTSPSSSQTSEPQNHSQPLEDGDGGSSPNNPDNASESSQERSPADGQEPK
ncbi:MAG: hypothetical protein LBT62_08090 [Deltaproteobacteria bacterium]|jgi:YbbR domain-containing protein|nr:hypothetical protein [Deltaproteobacteria bacterium]